MDEFLHSRNNFNWKKINQRNVPIDMDELFSKENLQKNSSLVISLLRSLTRLILFRWGMSHSLFWYVRIFDLWSYKNSDSHCKNTNFFCLSQISFALNVLLCMVSNWDKILRISSSINLSQLLFTITHNQLLFNVKKKLTLFTYFETIHSYQSCIVHRTRIWRSFLPRRADNESFILQKLIR